MNSSNSARLGAAALAAMLTAGAAPAADQDLTAPSRQDRFALQQVLADTNMSDAEGTAPRPDGEPAAEEGLTGTFSLPAAQSPARELLDEAFVDLQREARGPAAPASAADSEATGRFLQRLRNGMQQSYNQSYRDGWNILHTHVKAALNEAGAIPPAMRFTVDQGRRASYEKSYKVAYEILHTAVKTVSREPGSFSVGGHESFRAVLRTARLTGYEKSHEDGWKSLHSFVKALDARPDLTPDPLHHDTLAFVRKAGYEQSYQDAWTLLEQGVKRIEQGVPNLGHVMEVVTRMSANCSYTGAWKGMHTVMRGFRDRQDLYPNEVTHRALRATLQASYEKSYQEAYEVLYAGADRLRSAMHSPRDFLDLGVRASGDKSYEDGWDILRDFAKEGLSGSFMDEFTRSSVRTSLEASYGKSYPAAYRILRQGFEQAASQS